MTWAGEEVGSREWDPVELGLEMACARNLKWVEPGLLVAWRGWSQRLNMMGRGAWFVGDLDGSELAAVKPARSLWGRGAWFVPGLEGL